MYNKIFNPNTNNLINIKTKTGKKILKNYIKSFKKLQKGGGAVWDHDNMEFVSEGGHFNGRYSALEAEVLNLLNISPQNPYDSNQVTSSGKVKNLGNLLGDFTYIGHFNQSINFALYNINYETALRIILLLKKSAKLRKDYAKKCRGHKKFLESLLKAIKQLMERRDNYRLAIEQKRAEEKQQIDDLSNLFSNLNISSKEEKTIIELEKAFKNLEIFE